MPDAVQSAPAAAEAGKDRYKWEVLGVLMLGLLMPMIDSSIVNVSLPTIMADFGCTVDDIEWVVTGYMLAFAVLMPLTAWFRDHIGHKKLYIGALLVFTLGSLLCAMAWNLPSLIAARIIQALGGGAIGPTSMAMLSEVFPPNERGKAIGYWGMPIVVGPAIGPTLGGFLTHTLGWRSIFTINLPVGVVAVLLSMVLLRSDTPRESGKRGFDLSGFVFLTLFLVSFLLGLARGEHDGWTSPFILSCFGLAVTGLAGFLLVESLVQDRIIDISLFKIPAFSACMLVTVMRSVALFGGLFLIPLFLQRLRGLDEIQSGLILLPGSLVMAAFMPLGGFLGDRVGPRYPCLVGMAAQFLFLYYYRDISMNTSIWGIIYPTMIRSLGMPLLMAPIMATILNSVPKSKIAMASSMNNIIQQVGGAIGIAALTTVLSHRTVFHMADMASNLKASTPGMRVALADLGHKALSLGLPHVAARGAALSTLGAWIGSNAMVDGFQDAFFFGAMVVAVSTLAILLLPTRAMHGEVPKEIELEAEIG